MLAALLLLASVSVQSWAVSTHRVPWRSDQAVVGLMARHILAGEGHPVFFWGVAYAGTLEPHFVAAVFAVLGPSVTSYRVAMGILFTLLALGAFALTRRLFGDGAGLFALAYFALPPFFLVFKGLMSDGAYDSVALHALAAVAVAISIDRAAPARRPLLLGLLGIVIGVGWWVMPITAPVSAVALVWLLVRRRMGLPGTALLAAGAVAGSFPWWFWNLRHGWASLHAPETGLVGLSEAARNLVQLATVSVPMLEGSLLNLPAAPWLRTAFPGSAGVCVLALGLLLAPQAWYALRGDSARRLLFASLLTVLPAVFSTRFLATDPRLSMAYYSLVPILLAAELARGSAGPWAAVRRIGAGVALAIVHVSGLLAARPDFRNDRLDVTGSLEELIRTLDREGARRVYANYWTAYRLSFESGEKILATPFPHDNVRYEPHRREVDRAVDPAVVLLPPRDECYGSFLRERSIPFRRLQADGFGIFLDLGPGALATLRAGLGLPLPREAYRSGWHLGAQPSTMAAGSNRTVAIEVENLGPCPWPVLVRPGAHWWPLDPGGEAIFDGPRSEFPSRPMEPGDRNTFRIPLLAPKTPGRYRLEYDMVYEIVEWFSTMGGQTRSVEVVVLPAAGATP